MRMQQLPLFNTAYADRDGHIAYVYNATLPVHPTGDYRFWQGVVPGDRSDLIATDDRALRRDPEGDRPADGLGAELQRHAVDVGVSDDARLDEVRRRLRRAAGHHPARAARHPHPQHRAGEDDASRTSRSGSSPRDVETADQFVDEIVSTAKAMGTERAKRAADVLATWDRQAEVTSDGTLLFYKFMTAAGQSFAAIGGFKVPTDDRRPLETPRGFKDPARAMAMLDKVAGEVEKEYGSLRVKWGDVLRFRRGNADLPGNGAPSQLGAIRTIGTSALSSTARSKRRRATRSTR